MQKKYIAIFSIAALVSISAGMVGADARTILHAGDHVIDAKRLADSVKETAQVLQQYQNEVKKYENMVIRYSGLPGFSQKLNEAVDALKTKVTGSSVIIKNISLDDSALRKRATNDQIYKPDKAQEYQKTLLSEVQEANKDTLNLLQESVSRTNDRDEAIEDIESTSTDGVVGTRQQKAGIQSLSSLHDIEEARMDALALMHQIEADEAAYTEEDRQQQATKMGQFYLYDPYNPSDYDKEHASTTENFGFLSTTYTGT